MQSPPSDVRLTAEHLLEVVPHVMRLISAEAAASGAEHPLTATQLQVLGAIKRGRDLASEVARELHITAATTSGVIDVLERRGLLERGAHPTDRRYRRLHLTPEGAAQLWAARERALQGLESLLARLAATDVVDVERGLSLLRTLLGGEVRRENAGR